jgi:hypothetical protein
MEKEAILSSDRRRDKALSKNNTVSADFYLFAEDT